MAETNINVGLNEGTGDINETEAQEVLQEDALMDESDLDDLDAEAAKLKLKHRNRRKKLKRRYHPLWISS